MARYPVLPSCDSFFSAVAEIEGWVVGSLDVIPSFGGRWDIVLG